MSATSDHSLFENALKNLNEAQKEAVVTIEGPVMVIAGPGTGKTQILTLRIANILLKTDTAPSSILALTFTDSGVRAMRERLLTFIGVSAYHVPIHTFHSFAGELIKRYPDAYDTIVGGRPASELEKIRIIEAILEDTSFKYVRPHGDPGYYVKPILQAISTLKKEYVTADVLSVHIQKQALRLEEIPKIHEKGAHKGKLRGEYVTAEKSLGKNQELLVVYRAYSAAMREAKLYDFEDMILDTIVALETHPDMLLDVQEQYQYILADEHQDVNQSQNRLIELIASYHERPNVFVVGDEKQAIYRFQGASLDNFLYFGDIYRGAKIIALEKNYRSDQAILDIAHLSIQTEDPILAPLRTPLFAARTFTTDLTQVSFSHTALEEAYVVCEIEDELKRGTIPAEIAVIVRTNREVELFTTLLRKAGVAVFPSADTDILSHTLTDQMLKLLTVIVEPYSEVVLSELLYMPYLNVLPKDAVRLLQARSMKEPLSLLMVQESRLRELGIENPETILNISALSQKAQTASVTKSPAEVVEYILHESGFLRFVMTHDPLLGEAVVRRFYDEVEGMCIRREVESVADVVRQFTLLKSYGLPLSAPILKHTSNAVSVMTAHKAKGLEFEVVVLPHLVDSTWGGSRGRSDLFELPIVKHEVGDEALSREDDERRLLYVALTRAKRRLLCTYAAVGVEGRAFVPSRFLADIDTGFTKVSPETFEASFAPLSSLTPLKTVAPDVEVLRATLLDRGWSATSFNNYMESPWEYIYKNVLRMPTVKNADLQFGTAIHYVLDRLVGSMKQETELPADSVIQGWLTLALQKNVLSDSEYTRLHERGLKAIFGYLETLHRARIAATSCKTEYAVSAVLKTGIPDFPEVELTGNFDRLDFGEDASVLQVVDYKTGKPKTRGEIEGTTKNSNGNYKRQLVFYALLLSLQEDTRLHSKQTKLSFVEPDAKGVIHEEHFVIQDDEIAVLKEVIIKATKEVVSGECLETACDPEKTDFCPLISAWQHPI